MGNKLKSGLRGLEFILKKYSPEILTGIGIVAGATGIVMACKKSMTIKEKLQPVVDEIDELKENAAENEQPVDKKELTKLFGKAAKIVVTEYGVAVIFIGAGFACNLAAVGKLKGRNAGLAASNAALLKTFNDYRERVKDELGEEKDNDFYYGLVDEKIKEKVVDPETGKEKTVTKTEKKSTKEENLSNTFFFGPGNIYYRGDPLLDRAFLSGIEQWACDQVVATGAVYNCEILKELGWDKKNIPASARTNGTLLKNHEDEIHPVSLGIHKRINDGANCAADQNCGEEDVVWVITISDDGYILDEPISSFMKRA